jgi:RimJ/RimL family protein N-acetyltransferase
MNRPLASQDVLRTLRNGNRYRLRPPHADDKPRVAECFEQLSAESRRLRFLGVKKALSESELEFLTITDGDDHIAVAALAVDDAGADGRMVGIARCLRLSMPPDSAELAIAVADAVQGVGLGQVLIEELMRAAEAQGIESFELEVLAENRGMRALAARFGGTGSRQDDGLLHYRIPVQVAAPVGDATAAPPAHGWAWLEPDAVLGALPREWLDNSDQAYRFGHGLAEELWQAIWDSWHPAQSRQVTEV